MRPIVDDRFYAVTRTIAWIVLAAMLVAVGYATWMSLANWTWIGV